MSFNVRTSGIVLADSVLEKLHSNYEISDEKIYYFSKLLEKLDFINKNESNLKNFLKSIFVNILDWNEKSFRDSCNEEKVELEEVLEFEKPSLVFDDSNTNKIYFYIIPYGCKFDEKDQRENKLKISYYSKFERILRKSNVKYGFMFNGEFLRFIYAESGLLTSYIELNLYELLEEENLKSFYNLFSYKRINKNNKENLFELIEKSQNEQVEITDKLSEQVIKALEKLVEAVNKSKIEKIPSDEMYEILVKIIMRFIFILYAEEIGVFPHGEPIYDENYGLVYLSNELFNRMHKEHDELSNEYDGWLRVLALFNLVYYGSNIPEFSFTAHGGDLFEPKITEFASQFNVSNKDLVLIFKDLMNIDNRRISYRAFSVEQIGYLYEGFLNYNLKLENNLYVLKKSNLRKKSGTYYTPAKIVTYIVEKTLEDLVNNKSSDEILKLKVVDPAMGSGAFLVQALRYISEKLVLAWTNENKYSELSYEEKLRLAKRQVSEMCIYGVDLNPMAVELAKISIWLETLSRDKPFTFLDHHFKVGNSLIGSFNNEGMNYVPNEVFKFKKDLYSKEYLEKISDLRTENGAYIKNFVEKTNGSKNENLNIFEQIHGHHFINLAERIERFSKTAIEKEDYEILEKEYKQILNYEEIKREKEKRNIWLANWFANEIDGALPITTKQLLEKYEKVKNNEEDDFIKWSRKISKELKFFHWDLEFPEVFYKNKGFDVVIGNPPWEVVKLKDSEFFIDKDEKIAHINKTNERKKEIRKLKITNPNLYKLYIRELQINEKLNVYIKNCGNFDKSSEGELNLYRLFTELFLNLRKSHFGIVVPTGLFTDEKSIPLFKILLKKNLVKEINDFINENIFRNVASNYRFSIFISKKSLNLKARIFLNSLEDLYEKDFIILEPEDIKLFNPNTKTLPMIKNNLELKILRKIFKNSMIIYNESKDEKLIKYIFEMFHMSNDSDKFVRESDLISNGFKRKWFKYVKNSEEYLPLLEGKNFFILNPRYNDIVDNKGHTEKISQENLSNPYYFPKTRYFVKNEDFNQFLEKKKLKDEKTFWFIYRKIARATDTRTFIFTPIKKLPMGNSVVVFSPKYMIEFLLLSTHIFDFCIRKKMQGVNLNFFYFYQFPHPIPGILKEFKGLNENEETLEDSVRKIVINLLNYSYDMEDFIKDLSGEIKPRKWNEIERMNNFAKLDAITALIYEISEEELEYIFDDFKAEKRSEESIYGKYLSRDLAFKYYNEFKNKIKRW